MDISSESSGSISAGMAKDISNTCILTFKHSMFSISVTMSKLAILLYYISTDIALCHFPYITDSKAFVPSTKQGDVPILSAHCSDIYYTVPQQETEDPEAIPRKNSCYMLKTRPDVPKGMGAVIEGF